MILVALMPQDDYNVERIPNLLYQILNEGPFRA